MTNPAAVGLLRQLLAHLTAQYHHYYVSHWLAAGTGFHGDHQMFSRFFYKIRDEIDDVAEIGIAVAGPKVATRPGDLHQTVAMLLGQWSVQDPLQSALESELDLQVLLNDVYESLAVAGARSLGVEDLLTGIAKAHEMHIYQLRQRMSEKTAMVNLNFDAGRAVPGPVIFQKLNNTPELMPGAMPASFVFFPLPGTSFYMGVRKKDATRLQKAKDQQAKQKILMGLAYKEIEASRSNRRSPGHFLLVSKVDGGYRYERPMMTMGKAAAATATKTDPGKWESAKAQAKSRMGGKHSARAMQLATQIYKKNGGGYSGPKPTSSTNSLKKWTKQKWGWSGGKKNSGVYLPKAKAERLKGSEAGRKQLARAGAAKAKATASGQQYSSHGLAAGTSLKKTAAKESPTYETASHSPGTPDLFLRLSGPSRRRAGVIERMNNQHMFDTLSGRKRAREYRATVDAMRLLAGSKKREKTASDSSSRDGWHEDRLMAEGLIRDRHSLDEPIQDMIDQLDYRLYKRSRAESDVATEARPLLATISGGVIGGGMGRVAGSAVSGVSRLLGKGRRPMAPVVGALLGTVPGAILARRYEMSDAGQRARDEQRARDVAQRGRLRDEDYRMDVARQAVYDVVNDQRLIGLPSDPYKLASGKPEDRKKIERAAESKGMVWDFDDPRSKPFIRLSKKVTGKTHLSEMSPEDKARLHAAVKRASIEYRGKTFPGYNQPISSDRPNKKKMVLAKEGDRVKLIHYGQKGYKHNYSEAAKKNYLSRSAGIRGKGGKLTANDKFSANYWARRDLWPSGKADGSASSDKRTEKAAGIRDMIGAGLRPFESGKSRKARVAALPKKQDARIFTSSPELLSAYRGVMDKDDGAFDKAERAVLRHPALKAIEKKRGIRIGGVTSGNTEHNLKLIPKTAGTPMMEVPRGDAKVKLQKPVKRTGKDAKHPFQGYIDFQGLQIDVENKRGSYRRGKDPDGNEWKCKMHHHYGEIRDTEGSDGDKLDVYVGPNHDSSLVVVIHQCDPNNGKYDEDKVMLGFNSEEEAIGAYKNQYDKPGFYREGKHTTMPIGQFWRWVHDKRKHGKKIAGIASFLRSRAPKAATRKVLPGDASLRAAFQARRAGVPSKQISRAQQTRKHLSRQGASAGSVSAAYKKGLQKLGRAPRRSKTDRTLLLKHRHASDWDTPSDTEMLSAGATDPISAAQALVAAVAPYHRYNLSRASAQKFSDKALLDRVGKINPTKLRRPGSRGTVDEARARGLDVPEGAAAQAPDELPSPPSELIPALAGLAGSASTVFLTEKGSKGAVPLVDQPHTEAILRMLRRNNVGAAFVPDTAMYASKLSPQGVEHFARTGQTRTSRGAVFVDPMSRASVLAHEAGHAMPIRVPKILRKAGVTSEGVGRLGDKLYGLGLNYARVALPLAGTAAAVVGGDTSLTENQEEAETRLKRGRNLALLSTLPYLPTLAEEARASIKGTAMLSKLERNRAVRGALAEGMSSAAARAIGQKAGRKAGLDAAKTLVPAFGTYAAGTLGPVVAAAMLQRKLKKMRQGKITHTGAKAE